MLRDLPRPSDPNLLVGSETFDDAGIYRLDDDTALAGTPYLGLWKLDCRSMTSRQLLAAGQD